MDNKAIMPINEVLYQIQATLKAPKNQYNSFGKYSYRSCEDILEAVKKELPYGTHLKITDEMIQLGDRYYVQATAVLTSGTEKLAVSACAREPLTRKGMDEAQITGATSSYARKYALNGLFCIDDTKDPDSTNGSESKTKPDNKPESKSYPKSDKKATEPQIKLLRSKLKFKDLDDSYVIDQLGVDCLENTPIGKVNDAIKLIDDYTGV